MSIQIPLVDLKAQYAEMKTEIDSAIESVIADTAFIRGKYARQFEEAFAQYIGVEHCVGCANGTDAIEIVLKVLGIGPGDEVIVPALTWISTSEAVSSVGATPVFVDIRQDTFTIHPDLIAESITERTRAIIPVHLYGISAELDEVREIAEAHDVILIEDAAQAHGARYRGRRVGTFGRVATFSFYPGKNLGAYGDAGCIVTNDADLAERARWFGNHGQPIKNEHRFEGRNSRLDGLQAAILTEKLKRLDSWNAIRRELAEYYRTKLVDLPIGFQECPDYIEHVYHVFAVRTPKRDALRALLAKEGVQTGIHYPTALPFLEIYREYSAGPSSYPVSGKLPSELLSLPMYPELTRKQIDVVSDVIFRHFSTL